MPSSEQLINIHTHRSSIGTKEWVIRSIRAQDYPPDPDPDGVYSVGVHPWDIGKLNLEDALKKVQLATENCQVLAIGEAGLDGTTGIDMDLQSKVFEAQVEIAEFAGLPVIIHAVKANERLVSFAKSRKSGVPLIIHGFIGGEQIAKDLVKFGYYLSFGSSLLNSEKTAKAFASLPVDKIFLETDESELPVNDIYVRASELKSMQTGKLAAQISEKTHQLFIRK